MTENSDYPKVTNVANTPIYHWDFAGQKCESHSDAEKWIWGCIGQLARFYCAFFCDHSLCNERSNVEVVDLDSQWKKVQHDLHLAMSYLPICKDNYCPACAVTKAFSYFPRLIDHSPIKPISTLKMNAIDCEEIAYAGEIQSKSVPCYNIETGDGEAYSVEEVKREEALLRLDFNNLPPFPPGESDELKSNLRYGQVVLFMVYPNKQTDMFKSLNQLNDQEGQEFQFHLNTAIAAATALEEYLELRYYYPNAMDKQEIDNIYSTILGTLNMILKKKGYDIYPLLYSIPSLEQTNKYPQAALLKEALMKHHKGVSPDIENNNLEGLIEVLNECRKKAFEPIPDVINEMQTIKFYRCLLPEPENDSSYSEPQRYFQMITAYWGLIRNIIIKTLSSTMCPQPNPLMQFITNIKKRIDLCFSHLNLDDLKEAQDTIGILVEILLGDDIDDFHAVPEYFYERLNKVDQSLEKVKLTIKPKSYPLTSAEKIFIDYAESEIEKHFLECEESWNSRINNMQRNNKQTVANNTHHTNSDDAVSTDKKEQNNQDSTKNKISSPYNPDSQNCDPSQNTRLNCWTTNNGDVFKISTVTNDENEGEASFKLYCGKMSKERALMYKLIDDRKVTVEEIIHLCYPDEIYLLSGKHLKELAKLYTKVKALVHGIRKKLTKAGINNEIITPLGFNIFENDTVYLRVKYCNNLDEKHHNCKNVASPFHPDEHSYPDDDDENSDENSIDEPVTYDSDKCIDGDDTNLDD